MRIKLLTCVAAFSLLVLSCPEVQAQWRPGLLPGVWWGNAPAGPAVTIHSSPPVSYQPMARYRIRVRPWWAAPPLLIPRPVYCAPAVRGPQEPSWGRYEGGWGIPPAAAPAEK